MRLKTTLMMLLTGLLILMTACQSGSLQPVFSTSKDDALTPFPFPADKLPIASMAGRLHSFDISPDRKTIAFATSQGLVLYDLNLKQTRILENTENVFSVVWSPDGSKLAAGGILMRAIETGISHLVIWNTSTWRSALEHKSNETVSVPFGAMAWSPDGKLLAVPFLPDRGLVTLNIETGKIVSQVTDFLVPAYDISWSPDGLRLIGTGDFGYGFRRWRLDNGEAIRMYDPRAAAAIQLAWSPDGERIASGHAYGAICFWTVATNKCDGFIHAHQNLVTSLAWSSDGTQLATGGGVIRIWDTHTGQMLTAFGQKDGSLYTRLEWLDPKTLVSLETGYATAVVTIVRFWDVVTGSESLEFHGASSSFGE